MLVETASVGRKLALFVHLTQTGFCQCVSSSGADSVCDHDHFGEFVDKHHGSQSQYPEQGQRQQDHDYCQGQGNVFQHDSSSATSVGKHLGQVTQILPHERDVSGFDRHIGAHGTHCDPYVCGGQSWGIVDSVTYHRRWCLLLQLLDDAGLFFGKQRRMYCVYSYDLG